MQPLYRGSPSAKCLYRDKTSIKTVAGDRLVVAGHQLLRRSHGSAHAEARTWNVGVSSRYVCTVEVLVAGCGRLFLEIEVIFALKVFLVEVLDRLTVRTGLVCATMPGLR
jgi:hypothetical protein